MTKRFIPIFLVLAMFGFANGQSVNRLRGTLTVAKGGTGTTTLTDHGVLFGSGTSAVTALSAGSAGQILTSGGASADPAWTTATYPATATGTGKWLYANGTNWVASTATLPATATGTGKVLIADGTNWVASTPTFPNVATGTGTILRADGTNWAATTATYPATTTANQLLYSSATNTVGGLTSANNSILGTNGSGVPSWGTALPQSATGAALSLGSGVLDTLGRTLVRVQNKSGGALAEGDVLVWDVTPVVVVSDAALNASHTIANNLSAENSFFSLELSMTGTADAGDSVTVYGTSYEGGAGDTAIVLIPATSAPKVMVTNSPGTATKHWSKIDSIKANADAVADGASAMTVNAYAPAGTILCDGANTDIAGVCIGAIADNAYGYIVTHGACKATVDAATTPVYPGSLLEGAANGDLVTDAAATAAKNAARALEFSSKDNFKILVFVDAM